MTIGIGELRTLARAAVYRFDPAMREEALEAIGRPDMDAVVSACMDALAKPDRNVRVAAVRVLGRYAGERGADGILRGLNDSKRRVREVSAKSSGRVLGDPSIVERLRAMVTDETEKRRIRGAALYVLAGPAGRPLPDSVAEAIGSLARLDTYRSRVLLLLLRAPLTEASEDLLSEIVRIGSKEEAVMATRALCGFRVAHIGEFQDPDERRRVEQTCAIASGRVWYWVPR